MTWRVKQLRRARGWTGAELGKRMEDVGIPWDRAIVANVENGRRRSFTVAELLALAVVFDVAPVHFLIAPDAERYSITPKREYEAGRVRAWVRGEAPLPGTNLRTFRTEVPMEELERGRSASELAAKREAFERWGSWDAVDVEAEKTRDPGPWTEKGAGDGEGV